MIPDLIDVLMGASYSGSAKLFLRRPLLITIISRPILPKTGVSGGTLKEFRFPVPQLLYECMTGFMAVIEKMFNPLLR